jgi:hypothetical protein
VKETARESGPLESGPKILILDPNDPEGSYQKLMEQRRKNLAKRKGQSESNDSQE